MWKTTMYEIHKEEQYGTKDETDKAPTSRQQTAR